MPRLAAEPNSESLTLEVEARVLGRTDTFINCLRGEHYSTEIPEYLAQEYHWFNAGPTPSSRWCSADSPRDTCWRRSASNYWRRSSRRASDQNRISIRGD